MNKKDRKLIGKHIKDIAEQMRILKSSNLASNCTNVFQFKDRLNNLKENEKLFETLKDWFNNQISDKEFATKVLRRYGTDDEPLDIKYKAFVEDFIRSSNCDTEIEKELMNRLLMDNDSPILLN